MIDPFEKAARRRALKSLGLTEEEGAGIPTDDLELGVRLNEPGPDRRRVQVSWAEMEMPEPPENARLEREVWQQVRAELRVVLNTVRKDPLHRDLSENQLRVFVAVYTRAIRDGSKYVMVAQQWLAGETALPASTARYVVSQLIARGWATELKLHETDERFQRYVKMIITKKGGGTTPRIVKLRTAMPAGDSPTGSPTVALTPS